MTAGTVIGTDSVQPIGVPTRLTESHERTNGRTHERITHVANRSSVSQRARRTEISSHTFEPVRRTLRAVEVQR